MLVERFDMNVAGAVLDGLDENQVGQFDDRRLFDGGRELVEIDFFDLLFDGDELVRFVGQLRLFLRRPQ